MFSSGYGQFIESQAEYMGYVNATKESKKTESSNYMYQEAINSHHDLVYSEFTEIITKRLIAQPYPKDYSNFNPFCPICLKFVKNTQKYTTCFISNQRNYLIHDECLKKDKSYEFRNIGQILQNSFIIEKNLFNSMSKNDQGFDFRAFYIQINFLHPMNQKSFMKINKKMSPNKNKFKINFNQQQQNSYFPNIILLPLTDFNIAISIHQMDKKGSNTKFTNYLSLKNMKQKSKLIIKSQEIIIQAEIIQDMVQKDRIISQMNYKYRYSKQLNIPLLRIQGLHINLPQCLLQESSSDQEFIIDSNSNIVQELLKEKTSENSTIKVSETSSPRKKPHGNIDLNKSFESTSQNQKINIENLIYTNTLIDFVKNNTQSRLFQNYLAQCQQQEIESIISHIKPKLVELITHQYGNYMVQKLFKVCSPYQRLDLLQTILPSLNDLVRNKQGTHTIQAFIQNFTLNQEYAYVCMQVRTQYYELCKNNNSTHFIQKIIKTFPFQYTMEFFHYTTEHLLHFALDKNAMCVIKHMMRKLRQLQGIQQTFDQMIELIKRQIVINVTFNVDRLIMDSFGNYVIQFCYELFDLQKCAGITQRILSRFFFYSLGKFSSNVLIKCISSYWNDKNIYKTLRGLNNNQIIQIFRNKDGNKVLLQIMQRLQGIQLWDRLYSVLIQIEPARYYHDRWGVCLGSRSGQVGYKLSGFPGSNKKNFNRKS